MKGLFVLLFALVATLSAASATLGRPQRPPPYINRPQIPRNPGTIRFRRSPDPEPAPEPQNRGSVSVQASGSPRRPTFSVDANRRVWDNRHGSVSVGGGVSKTPGRKPDPHVGVTGSFRFRRSPEPAPEPQNRGSVSVQASGSPKRPSVNVDANHKVWGNKHGSINVGGGVSKQPGRKPDSHVGISGSFKF